jgi:hypothetical protein
MELLAVFNKRTRTELLAVVLIFATGGAFVASQNRPVSSIPMPDESVVELTIQHEGNTYKLIGGDLYKVTDSTDRLVFVDRIYDKDFREKNYATVEGRVYRIDTNSGKMYPTRRHFADGFEGADQTADLIGIDRGWTTFTLQSPLAPSVPKYNQLRNRILRDGADFLDNRVEPSSEVVHSGDKALKCYSMPPSPKMTTAKASLSTTLLHFTRGDDVWFSGWYYVAEGGMPFTIMDLECTHFKEHPGMRIMVGQDGYVRLELKWAMKPMYRQPREKRVLFPTGRWVHLKSRLKLSEAADGVVQLWQDGVKLIDEHGQTLPLAKAIYDSLEIGISAHSFGPDAATLFVDDIVISEKPVM